MWREMEKIDIPAEWSWDELNHLTQRQRDPGPDYLTAKEWAELWEVSRDTAMRRLNQVRKAGRLEVGKRTTWRMGDTPYPTPVYKIVKE